MPTIRQRMIELLSEETFTIQDLSSEMRISMKEVLHHLEHARKSVRLPRRFIVESAECLSCGFVFKNRKKLHSPGKCPKCRNSHIQEPMYRIE